jgi:ribosomal protein S6--L-glutamate ligase
MFPGSHLSIPRYHVSMRLLVLSARPGLRTNLRLSEAGSELGVEVSVVDATTLSAVLENTRLSPVGDGVLEPAPEAVLARVGNWRPESLLAVLEAIVDRGAATPNPPPAIRVGRDHWATARCLGAAGLPILPMVAGADPETLADASVNHLGLPVVVKQRRSRMGVGVILCATFDHLEAVLDSLWRLGDEIVVQRYLPGGETSYRLLVVGKEVVAAARLEAADGDWRSNAARGGLPRAYTPRSEEVALAVAAAEAVGLGQCGVDLVMGEAGPIVLEVNPTPGFLHLEAATGIDVARTMVAHAVESVRD